MSTHILERELTFSQADYHAWLRYALNDQPDVRTSHRELKIFRGIYLRNVAVLKDAKVFAEVGTARGWQSMLWARTLAGRPGTVYTCDPVGMHERIYRKPPTGNALFTRNELWDGDPEARQRIVFTPGTSGNMAQNIDMPLDMVYIDGSHTYSWVWEDFKNLLSHMTEDTTVFFDDCDERFPGVQKAVREIAESRNQPLDLLTFEPDKYKVAILWRVGPS